MRRFAIGVDFGTESARGVLVDVGDGRIVTTATYAYPHGVIDRALPGADAPLPPDWALQHPGDWLEGLRVLLRAMAAAAPADAIIGIGIDFTSCTVMPTTADGTPLCLLSDYRAEPHAWPKLWKHHAAQPYADKINTTAGTPEGAFLELYGGRTSSEWSWAKAWQVAAEAPHVARAAGRWIEGGDWIVWQLIGEEVRSACQAGYKAHWQKDTGYPPASYWAALHPDLPAFLEKLGPTPQPVSARAGGLCAAWAQTTGLRADTPVAVAVIDAHAAVPAVGAAEAGHLVAIMGTSTCHLIVSDDRRAVRGISGVVEDGILPGFFGYEAGQASVGDIFQWFVRTAVPATYAAPTESGVSVSGEPPTLGAIYDRLESEAARLAPGQSGLLALDWWNGCRTPLVDADLSGLLVGLTVTTEPHEIYRALLESTAFGTRRVIETFEDGGVPVRHVHACGGLAERNPLLLQITADIIGRDVLAAAVPHASAVGAAIYAAVAAGARAGGYPTMAEAVARMGRAERVVYRPRPSACRVYEDLYRDYRDLARYFGEGGSDVMARLRARRRAGAGGLSVQESEAV
jgi:L-ribulokinase